MTSESIEQVLQKARAGDTRRINHLQWADKSKFNITTYTLFLLTEFIF